MSDAQQGTPESVPTAPPYAPAGSPTAVPQQDPYAFGASPYAGPPTPYGSPAAPRTGAHPLGRIGVIIGIVGLAIGLVSSIVVQAMIFQGMPSQVGAVNLLFNILVGICAVIALVFGVIALRSPEGKGAAGVSLGLGIAGCAGLVITFAIMIVTPLFASLAY